MYKRIKRLSDSACSKCGMSKQCDDKICGKNYLKEIKNQIFGIKNYKYKECPLYIALNCKGLIDG